MRKEGNVLMFYLVRHGESVRGKEKHLISGRCTHTRLTDLGTRQPRALGRAWRMTRLRLDAVLVSPARRARDTGRIACAELPGRVRPRIVRDLQEFSQGDWENRPRDEVYTSEARARMRSEGYDFTPPGGESQRMVEARAVAALRREVLDDPDFEEGERRIAVFSHGMVIRTLVAHALGADRSTVWKWALDNASVTVLRCDDRGWSLVRYNDVSHLRDL